MAAPRFALDERADLVATLRDVTAHDATLCGDWTAAQLATHLLLRERSPVDILGRLPLARAQAVSQRHLDRYLARHGYADVIDRFAAGPPALSPLAIPAVRERVNLLEYLIHHEDVRRARIGWQPRDVPAEHQRAIWSSLRLAARVTLRAMPGAVRLVLSTVTGTGTDAGAVTVGRGPVLVTATGDAVELSLFAFGRQRVARLDYAGAPADVEAAKTATIAL